LLQNAGYRWWVCLLQQVIGTCMINKCRVMQLVLHQIMHIRRQTNPRSTYLQRQLPQTGRSHEALPTKAA
jgi:hypothetical protein